MGSNKLRATRPRESLAPQRRRGELRVASLMAAAADVIAKRGFEAATMAEIAARGGAKIGSLYRFFPNKEAVADALIQRYRELIDTSFQNVEDQAAVMSVGDLADTLLNVLAGIPGETRAVVALLDARSDWSEKRIEFRQAAIQRITRILLLSSPKLGSRTAEAVAVVLLHNMKTVKAQSFEECAATNPRVAVELRDMNRIYLESALSKK